MFFLFKFEIIPYVNLIYILFLFLFQESIKTQIEEVQRHIICLGESQVSWLKTFYNNINLSKQISDMSCVLSV